MTKKKFFIVWVDGLGRGREYIQAIGDAGASYTRLLTEAMRIEEKDVEAMKSWMKTNHISQWVIDSPDTFVRTSYAPKGTLHRF